MKIHLVLTLREPVNHLKGTLPRNHISHMVSKFEGILTEVFDYSITPVYGGNKASGARMGKVVDLGKNLHNCLMR